MLLDERQLEQLDELGYVVIKCPFPLEATEACREAVDTVAEPRPAGGFDGDRTQGMRHLLPPQLEGSYWSLLDHSLPFLQVCLHSEILELGRQVVGVVGEPSDDIYMRNAGINDMGPGHSVAWHHDGSYGIELMHYFGGATKANGCLRILPGSHKSTGGFGEFGRRQATEPSPYEAELLRLREEQGLTERQAEQGNLLEGWSDVEMEGEISIELEPHEILVRHSRIFHATHENVTGESRLLNHWGYQPHFRNNHRIRFEEVLTPRCLDALSREQKDALWIGRQFQLAPQYGPLL